MFMSRLETLLGFLEEDPQDGFTRFAIAQEYHKLGRTEDAIRVLQGLIDTQPAYVGAYYHLGKLYEEQGFSKKAEEVYQLGIQFAEQEGSFHDKAELQNALMSLRYDPDDD